MRHIRLVIFDMDGTLTCPRLDFSQIRRAIGVPDTGILILDYILGLPAHQRAEAYAILQRFEEEAATEAEPQEGAQELLAELRRRGIKTAIFTRNSRESVRTVLERLGLEVDLVVSRDDAPPKPAPDAILGLMRRWRVSEEEALMVGDFPLDIEAGSEAGVGTVLLVNNGEPEIEAQPDFRIEHLSQLLELIDQWPQHG